MPARKHYPEESIGKLCEVEIMLGHCGTDRRRSDARRSSQLQGGQAAQRVAAGRMQVLPGEEGFVAAQPQDGRGNILDGVEASEGYFRFERLAHAGSLQPAVIGVSVKPGDTEFTRIPRPPNSWAATRTI